MRIIGLAVLSLILVGRAEAETPSQRGRKILDAQVASLTDSSKPKLELMFDPKSLVLGAFGGETLEAQGRDLKLIFAGGSPHSVIKKAKVASFSGGGTESAVWFTAEIAITVRNHEPESKGPETRSHTMRLTELVVADGGSWKVVASVLDQPLSPHSATFAPDPVHGSTTAGPLAALPASIAALKTALANDPGVVVIGTDKGERAVGPKAAKKQLDRWSKLKLEMDTKVREVRTTTWGYVQSNIDMVKGDLRYQMAVLLIALPSADGTWSVGAVHYTAH